MSEGNAHTARVDLTHVVREWRWTRYSYIPRGQCPEPREVEDHDEPEADLRIVRSIDSYDQTAGYPEPESSVKLRALAALDDLRKRDITPDEAVKLLAWLDQPEATP